MNPERTTQIAMVPIQQIALVNPRSRGRKKFQQIVDNIASLGLKRPITVTPRRNPEPDGPKYDLVCGQGRLEAFQALGQQEVPAFIVEATKDELLLMSLAENLARRKRTASELMGNIATLKEKGYSPTQIAKKTDLDVSYVKGILRLLSKGEERLLRAVEAQQIPISIAVTIASADDAEVQRALADAYEQNTLRGKDLLRARRLIEARRARGKPGGSRRPGGRLDAATLLREYEKESARQQVLVKQAKVCETRFQFVLAGLRRLLGDADFVAVLREQDLGELPQHLSEQLAGERRANS